MGVWLGALVPGSPCARFPSVFVAGAGVRGGSARERSGLSVVARPSVALGGDAQDDARDPLGDWTMMVTRYELECGTTVEIMVASDQVGGDQVIGHISAWCPTCHVEHPVTRVQLQVR
jgi:hypothetical protein